MRKESLLILIAPNVSEQMGGEAIKALQIFEELKKLHPNTFQIAHARNRSEVARLKLEGVSFVDDTWFSMLLWRTVVFRGLLEIWYSAKAVKLAEHRADRLGSATEAVVIHQTEPNSPVVPRALSKRHANVFGPINGNIYYPPMFRGRERFTARVRRLMHMPSQRLNRLLPRGIKCADQILVAGGERTEVSLKAAGCPQSVLKESLDCGIRDDFLKRPRVTHQGENLKFVHFGRLVFHKGTSLIIESLPKTRHAVCLDIVGRGPELQHCRELVRTLRLEDRVRFLDWYTVQDDLFRSFPQYRGVVLPSIEDANGIVIQEAMAMGLPPICLDWGGPSLLIEHGRSGFLIEPVSTAHITTEIARHMDQLAQDPELAESISRAAREIAGGWRWSALATDWLEGYPVRRSTGRENSDKTPPEPTRCES